jgi:hypothetical protein
MPENNAMTARSTAPRVELHEQTVRISLPALGLAGSWGYWIVCLALLAVPQLALFGIERLPVRPPGLLFFTHGACWMLQAVGFYGVLRPLLVHFLCEATIVATPERLTVDRAGWLFIAGTRLSWTRDELRCIFADAGGLWIVPRDDLPHGLFFERPRDQVDLMADLIRAALDAPNDWPLSPGAISAWFVLDDVDGPFDLQLALAGQLRLEEGCLILSHVWHRVCVTFEMRLRAEAPGNARQPWFAGGVRQLSKDASAWRALPVDDGPAQLAWRTECSTEEPGRLTMWSPVPGALEAIVASFWGEAEPPAMPAAGRAA